MTLPITLEDAMERLRPTADRGASLRAGLRLASSLSRRSAAFVSYRSGRAQPLAMCLLEAPGSYGREPTSDLRAGPRERSPFAQAAVAMVVRDYLISSSFC
jgi:hypothetical protein